jgi:hypothetical protein
VAHVSRSKLTTVIAEHTKTKEGSYDVDMSPGLAAGALCLKAELRQR